MRVTRSTLLTAALLSPLLLTAPLLAGTGWVELRIVTLNVKEGLVGPAGNAYEAVSDMVTTVDENTGDGAVGLLPDIACFQELDPGSPGTLTTYRDNFLPGYQIFGPTGAGDGFNYQAILVRPDITIIETDTFGTPGPRDGVTVVLEIPGSDEYLKVYTAHFKAFGDSSSRATRTAEANTHGASIAADLLNGFVPGVPLENQHVVLAGDLNSNNNSDGTLNGLFAGEISTNACCAPEDGSADENFMIAFGVDCATMSPCCVPDVSSGLCNLAGGTIESFQGSTGLTDIVYESLSASQSAGTSQTGTFGSSRLDYIMANEALALRFDTNGNQQVDQTEANQIGFVYYSNQNVSGVHFPGQFANGNSNASSNASDHDPVVATFRFLPAAPTGACCLGDSCSVLTESNCLALTGMYLGDDSDCSGEPCAPANSCIADFDDDGDVDLGDFGVFGAAFNSGVGDPNFSPQADFDDDGDVDLGDFGVFGSEFGRSDCLIP